VIGPWQHRVHMRSSLTSMSAAVRSLECAAPLSQVLQSAVWTMGRGDTCSISPIPLVYTANLIGVDPSMCIPLCTILSN